MATNPGTTSLVAWWGLNEESGTRVDSHGSNDLTDNNTVLFAAGKQGNAADFEATTSEYLSTADNASLSTGDIDYTFCGWFKMETIVANGILIAKYTDATHRDYQIYIDTDDSLHFNTFETDGTASGGIAEVTTGALSTGVFYFFVAFHSATDNEVGVSINAGTLDTAATVGPMGDSTAGFEMGSRANTLHWDGLIDEVCFYKRKLLQSEIDWLYNSGAGRDYSEAAFTPRAVSIF